MISNWIVRWQLKMSQKLYKKVIENDEKTAQKPLPSNGVYAVTFTHALTKWAEYSMLNQQPSHSWMFNE